MSFPVELSRRSMVLKIKTLLFSSYVKNTIKLFALGAGVSTSGYIIGAVKAYIRRSLFATAVFRYAIPGSEAYRWILHFMTTHPSFQRSLHMFEVESTSRSSMADVSEVDCDDSTDKDLDKEGSALVKKQDWQRVEGLLFLPVPGQKLHFVFEGTHYWATFNRKTTSNDCDDESITLSCFSLNSAVSICRLIKHARQVYESKSPNLVTIMRFYKANGGFSLETIQQRSEDSLYLPERLKRDVLEDVRRFLSAKTRQWYGERGIPHRRGYLLYGPPGTGKSTLCHVLASVLNLEIYIINLNVKGLDDYGFQKAISRVPPRSIVLIEDVDATFVQREVSSPKGSQNSEVSFSALLNVIDGTEAIEGRLLFLTTNHIERLDEALIRPGRVDMRIAFNYATVEQAKSIFLRWYMPKDSFSADIDAKADVFAASVCGKQLSIAALQGFLLTCGNDHQKAVDELAIWIREQKP